MAEFCSKHPNIMLLVPLVGNYFKENFRVFEALEFIAFVTAHISPNGRSALSMGTGASKA